MTLEPWRPEPFTASFASGGLVANIPLPPGSVGVVRLTINADGSVSYSFIPSTAPLEHT